MKTPDPPIGVDYERGGTQKAEYGPDEVEAVACLYCGATSGATLAREHGSLGVMRCDACGLLYTSPRPRAVERNYWGDREAYRREARLVFEGRAPHHRDPNYREELDFIGRHVRGGRFLDVGCNMGMLLRLARERGWETVGIDPSPSLSALAREELGLDVHTCWLHEAPAALHGTFDVVALSDVFEHVTDPLGMLADARRMLAPGGILYVKVPNAGFTLFKQRAGSLLGRALQHGIWDSYEHVAHYTDLTLRRMLEKGGFRVIALSLPGPVQIPVWHHRVGQYFQHPSPWILDWRRHLGRALLHRAGQIERILRGGSVGYLPPALAVVARPAADGGVRP